MKLFTIVAVLVTVVSSGLANPTPLIAGGALQARCSYTGARCSTGATCCTLNCMGGKCAQDSVVVINEVSLILSCKEWNNHRCLITPASLLSMKEEFLQEASINYLFEEVQNNARIHTFGGIVVLVGTTRAPRLVTISTLLRRQDERAPIISLHVGKFSRASQNQMEANALSLHPPKSQTVRQLLSYM
ncbi:hypothetical protein B0J17DRAFT_628724 [Rhizoctonia solani]|nr:hypothetical protein B0J17DRAFT_628724 [Rhizoctonia solani]